MLKPFLLSIGIYLCILGGECLVLDRAIMAQETPKVDQPELGLFRPQTIHVTKKKEVVPSEWAPWTFLSVGAVVILYAASMQKS